MADNVTLVRDGAIATVTLARPDRRNSLSDPMLRDLAAAFAELRDDAGTRVVIVSGAPPVFSAGADAPIRRQMSEDDRRQAFLAKETQFRRLFERANTLLENLEQATIAMINGHDVGGGWGLTLACDFRWAAAQAELWIPEVDLGVPLGVASTTRFVRLVGPARAKEIIMECRRYSAEEARVLGLVHRVVAGDALAKEVRAFAERMATKPFRALARRSDVVIENFLPGVADRLGIGYRAVSAGNPAVVYASITSFGQDGPYARRAGYNTIAQGMSGLMALTGMPGHPPTKVGGSVSDLAAALHAFGTVNAALVHRFRSGRGQHLDVSLLASTLGLLPDPIAHFFASGGARPRREGNRNPTLAPAEAFQTKDGFLNVVIMSPDQWERFCHALGDPELAGDPRFANNDARVANRDEFRARVEARLATATTEEWVRRLEKATIACGPIYEFDEVFADAQVQHLGLVTEMEQPGYGRIRMLGFPVRGSEIDARVRRPAPALGEHTAEILGELGIERREIDALAASGVIALARCPGC